MFTGFSCVLGAVGMVIFLTWSSTHGSAKEKKDYDQQAPGEAVKALAFHCRQDLKLIAYHLTGILVMLGVIADKIH